jgi:hypothetical protein
MVETPEQEETETRQDESVLEDAGKKALTTERRARAAAEKQAKELRGRLDAIEAEKLSDQEKAIRFAEAATADAKAARAEAMRYKFAAKNGFSDEDAEIFLTGSDEETLTRQAERLTTLLSEVRQPAKSAKGLKSGVTGSNQGLDPKEAAAAAVRAFRNNPY